MPFLTHIMPSVVFFWFLKKIIYSISSLHKCANINNFDTRVNINHYYLDTLVILAHLLMSVKYWHTQTVHITQKNIIHVKLCAKSIVGRSEWNVKQGIAMHPQQAISLWLTLLNTISRMLLHVLTPITNYFAENIMTVSFLASRIC